MSAKKLGARKTVMLLSSAVPFFLSRLQVVSPFPHQSLRLLHDSSLRGDDFNCAARRRPVPAFTSSTLFSSSPNCQAPAIQFASDRPGVRTHLQPAVAALIER